MPRRTLRFVLGTWRLRVRTAISELRGRTRRRPPCSRLVPRPPGLRPAARPLRLTHALVASDLNPSYLCLWPLARRAWAGIAGLEPVLVLVAEPEDVPEEILSDPSVRLFEPVHGLHTAFQAQCIRLLYPALVETDGGVVVSDIDMVPLNTRYLSRPASHIPEDHFISYRDVLLDVGEVPICYNAGRPQTWGAVFGVCDLDDARAQLSAWADGVSYAGVHGGAGWTTDQLVLYRTLLERGRRSRDVWILDDAYTGFRRLERAYVQKWGELSPAALRGLARGRYSDFHCLPPGGELGHLNELVLDLAQGAAER